MSTGTSKNLRALMLGVALAGSTVSSVAAEFELTFFDGMLSLDAQGASLRAVLTELARSTGVTVVVPAGMADTELNFAFEDVDFEYGVKRILDGVSYTLTHQDVDSVNSGRPPFAEIRVLSTGLSSDQPAMVSGGTSVVVLESSSRNLEAGGELDRLANLVRQAEEPGQRIDAISELVEFDESDEIATVTLMQALSDPAPGVRAMALSMLQIADPRQIPIENIAQVAFRDQQLEIRKQALTFLASSYPIDESFNYLAQAQRDRNPEISALGNWLIQVYGSE